MKAFILLTTQGSIHEYFETERVESLGVGWSHIQRYITARGGSCAEYSFGMEDTFPTAGEVSQPLRHWVSWGWFILPYYIMSLCINNYTSTGSERACLYFGVNAQIHSQPPREAVSKFEWLYIYPPAKNVDCNWTASLKRSVAFQLSVLGCLPVFKNLAPGIFFRVLQWNGASAGYWTNIFWGTSIQTFANKA